VNTHSFILHIQKAELHFAYSANTHNANLLKDLHHSEYLAKADYFIPRLYLVKAGSFIPHIRQGGQFQTFARFWQRRLYNSCNFFFNSFLPSKGHFFKKRGEQIGPISNQETIILLL
jgi:hypothetical protein